MYVKPEGEQLTVLLRVPMETFSEIAFPVRGPGYLDLDAVDAALADTVSVYFDDGLRFFVDGEDLESPVLAQARVSLPSNRAFDSYDAALAHLNDPPLGNDIDLFWNQAMLDVRLTYTAPPTADSPELAAGKLSFRTALGRLADETLTVLRYLPPDGPERAYNYVGDPGVVELDPGWWGAISRFVVLGFWHILQGPDHLLFLLALVIPMRSIGPLVLVVTSFTIAHTITLVSAALGMAPSALWFPPLIETLIALSVFYMACENLFGARQDARWMFAFGFGLIHGFGFSFILSDRLQFAGEHLVGSLLAFNIGVELGQMLVVAIAVPLLWALFRFALLGSARERMGIILLSALVAHSAWHWLIERGSQLPAYSWRAPVFDAAFFAAATRWAMLAVGSVIVLLAMQELVNRLRRSNSSNETLR